MDTDHSAANGPCRPLARCLLGTMLQPSDRLRAGEQMCRKDAPVFVRHTEDSRSKAQRRVGDGTRKSLPVFCVVIIKILL